MTYISVVIPALNEQESIGHVLAAIPREAACEIIVVDGGSTDDTVAIAEENGALVIREPRRGYGLACKTGVAAARSDVVVFLDADGANDPSQIPEIADPLLAGRADMVLGSRLIGSISPGAMPWHQRFGNWLSAKLISLLYRVLLTDLAPFRAVSRKMLAGLDLQDLTYGYPTEMIVKAARQGWRIIEVPVSYHPRLGGRSKVSGTVRGTVRATYSILRTIFRYAR
jgi:glycosyltransferase involved in cell wall biosynthesis